MFTNKHYKIIASAIKEASNSTNIIDKNRLVGLLSFYFSTDNSRFNEEKFKETCNG